MRFPSGSTTGSVSASSASGSLGRSQVRPPSWATWSMVFRAAWIALMARPPFTSGLRADRFARKRAGSGAEDAGGDAQAGGGGLVAGLVLVVGDLAGDRAELGGDRRLVGGHAVEAVEHGVVFGASRCEDRDDVLDAGAADVGDVGVHPAARRAGAGGAAD